jgi:hypothetical protein
MLYAAAAVERAMKIQQVIVRALSGAITWVQAADILGDLAAILERAARVLCLTASAGRGEGRDSHPKGEKT